MDGKERINEGIGPLETGSIQGIGPLENADLPAGLQAGAQTGIDKGDTEPCGEALVRHKAATAGQQQVR